MPAKRAASKSAEPSIGRFAIFVPDRARSANKVVTPATKTAHHMATRQAFFASSTLLTSGQNQDELFMETLLPVKMANESEGGHRTPGQVRAGTSLGRLEAAIF